MSTFVEKEVAPWDQTKAKPPPVQRTNIPLHAYPLEKLTATLKRNEAMLKNSHALEALPDKGKKLAESSALIRDAIRYKTKQPKQGTRIKPLDKVHAPMPPQLGVLETQLQKLTLSTSSLGSSGASSSGRQSLSSVASDSSPAKVSSHPPRVSLQATSTISLREALRMRQAEEIRLHKERENRFQADKNRSASQNSRYHPYFDFDEDDSDDFDGFSEDEYL